MYPENILLKILFILYCVWKCSDKKVLKVQTVSVLSMQVCRPLGPTVCCTETSARQSAFSCKANSPELLKISKAEQIKHLSV